MEADWIERSVSAAQQRADGVDSKVVQQLTVELASRLTARELRPREVNELADDLIGLSVMPAHFTSNEGSIDADQKHRS